MNPDNNNSNSLKEKTTTSESNSKIDLPDESSKFLRKILSNIKKDEKNISKVISPVSSPIKSGSDCTRKREGDKTNNSDPESIEIFSESSSSKRLEMNNKATNQIQPARRGSDGAVCRDGRKLDNATKLGKRNNNSPVINVQEDKSKKRKGNQPVFVGAFCESVSSANLKFQKTSISKLEQGVGGSRHSSPLPSNLSRAAVEKPSDKFLASTAALTKGDVCPKKAESRGKGNEKVRNDQSAQPIKRKGRSDNKSEKDKTPVRTPPNDGRHTKMLDGEVDKNFTFPPRGDSEIARGLEGLSPTISNSPFSPTDSASRVNWQRVPVRRGKRKAESPAQTVVGTFEIKKSNRFEALENQAVGVDPRSGPPGASDNNSERENLNKEQIGKIPPIYIENPPNWVALYKKMKDLCTLPPTARLAGRKTVIKCQIINDFLKVRDLLTDENINIFTYRLASEKKKLFVIRGLPLNTDISDITESFTEQGVRVNRITQMKTTKPTQSQIKENIKSISPRFIPLFMVELENELSIEDFFSIKYICGLKITIEKYKSTRGPPQCYRCQAFGHVEKACHMPPRCVKCGKNHLTIDCEMPKTLEATCANCQGNHPASYRGCAAYLRMKKKINKLKSKSQEKESGGAQAEKIDLDKKERGEGKSKIPESRSYAEIVKENPRKEVVRKTGSAVGELESPTQISEGRIVSDQHEEVPFNENENWRDELVNWDIGLDVFSVASLWDAGDETLLLLIALFPTLASIEQCTPYECFCKHFWSLLSWVK
ncbi:hypothetical protein J437_LFUL007329 [Ladona fulva]|uniref:Pre-C2HC domain-containing protein n=1 Tax=Ladona fulva TaxID=123851 RepID=A0A8K0P570_LADFU|nr:hypothetical protein J437_LFUL007329 [Ladona fulva]